MSGDVRNQMLLLKALDSAASILLSQYTQQWYVSARIEIGDGVMLAGVAEHRDTPQEAVAAMFERLCDLGLDHYIAASPYGDRRNYRWNGAAFAEVPS